jgi:hypothetical protein
VDELSSFQFLDLIGKLNCKQDTHRIYMVNYPFVRVRTGISRGFVLLPYIPYIFAAFSGDHSLILQVYEIYEKDQEAARAAAAKASEDGDGEERPMQNDKFEIYHA